MDKNTILYGKYKLKDLTVTSHNLPNMPNDAEFKNLKWLAKVLTKLEQDIGPFTILSAFRSYQVNNAVLGYDPYAEVNRKKSFHEAGMAVDIWPSSQTIESFFGKILASEYWIKNLGEISIKPSQNAIHIGLPTATLVGKILKLSGGTYVPLTEAEIKSYREPYEVLSTPVNNEPPVISPQFSSDRDASALEFDWSHINSDQNYLMNESSFDLDFSFMDDFGLDSDTKKVGFGLGLLSFLGLGSYFLFRK